MTGMGWPGMAGGWPTAAFGGGAMGAGIGWLVTFGFGAAGMDATWGGAVWAVAATAVGACGTEPAVTKLS